MKDTMIMEIKDGHFVIPSDLLGNLMVRFGESADTISSSRSLPFLGDGIRQILSSLKKIEEAQPSLFIYLPYDADTITINGVAYCNFSFEVKKFPHRDELSVYVNGKKVNGSWSEGLTDAARKTVQKEINDLFYDRFDSLAENCRNMAIDDYKKKTAEDLQKAANNIEATQDFLKGLDA